MAVSGLFHAPATLPLGEAFDGKPWVLKNLSERSDKENFPSTITDLGNR
jgi:hypothetical protein